MKERIDKVLNHPIVVHAMAANERYGKRLGPQFAGAITYFSVLSMVPILMFAFAVLGMTFTWLRPDLMDQITSGIVAQLGDQGLGQTIGDFIKKTLSQWQAAFGFGLLTAAYSGSNWVGNLKRAVRVMWSDRFLDASKTKNFFVELALNLLTFFGLLLCVAVSLSVSQVGSAFSRQVIALLGWEHVWGIEVYWRIVAIGLTFVASWLLFAFLFIVLPNQPVRPRAWIVGTLIGALLVTILQSLAGLLVGAFGGNATANLFGPVIVMMLLFNLLATIILMVAAWVGTDDTWRAQHIKKQEEQRSKLIEDAGIDVDADADAAAQERAETKARLAANLSLDDLRRADATSLPPISKDTYVRQDVAKRGMSAGLGIGYGVGAATGIGIGALIVGGLKALTRRRKQ